ncbi:arylsulfatase [Haloferula helveola]|uniref:Arylsulfatase n=1 Tax=Haloferula helveola TaxID=490095 RepID=A0ABM7RCT0_9BACT|nr:arylsulfatase [Haloferula helveola]
MRHIALAFAAVSTTASAEPPSILHIIADDLGWNDVGFHGSEIPTPNIDRLSKQSVVFNRFYVSPICSPTRAGCLTGRYPFRFGIWNGVCNPQSRHGLPGDELTIAEWLGEHGYRHRGLIGKWHLGLASTRFHPLEHGFTEFLGHYNGAIDYFSHERHGELDWHRNHESLRQDGYSTDLLGDAAVEFVTNRPTPFHLLVAFNAPHSPLQAKRDDLDAVGFDSAGPRCPNTDKGIAKRESAPDYGEEGKGNTKRQTFAAMTRSMDENIGRILDALDRRNIADNTLVVFHSDNGADPKHGGSNQPLRGNKFTTWEGGVRVVALARWPGKFDKGSRFGGPVCYLDLFPTFATATGSTAPEGLDGTDLLPALTGRGALPKREILLGKDTVISGEWKRRGDQLFDVESDPEESHNVADLHPQIFTRLGSRLARFTRLSGPPVESSATRTGSWPPIDWKLPEEPPSP